MSSKIINSSSSLTPPKRGRTVMHGPLRQSPIPTHEPVLLVTGVISCLRAGTIRKTIVHWFKDNADPGVQGFGNPSQHAEGMTFVAGRLQTADLLLRGAHPPSQFCLRHPAILPQFGNLQCHIPGFTRLSETFSKRWIFKLLFQIAVEICLLPGARFLHSKSLSILDRHV